jgi:DUF2934 family protein
MNLPTLELTPDELKVAEAEVRRKAFEKWLSAGCPECNSIEFWLEAEREWIAFQYVPDRSLSNGR